MKIKYVLNTHKACLSASRVNIDNWETYDPLKRKNILDSHNFCISISVLKIEMITFAIVKCMCMEIEVPTKDILSKVDGAQINNPIRPCTINTYRFQSMFTTLTSYSHVGFGTFTNKALNPNKFCIQISNKNILRCVQIPSITLFISIIVFCGVDNISHNILCIESECREYYVEYCRSHITLVWI